MKKSIWWWTVRVLTIAFVMLAGKVMYEVTGLLPVAIGIGYVCGHNNGKWDEFAYLMQPWDGGRDER